MCERPDILAAGEVGEDPDAAGSPQRGAVFGAAVLALDREALSSGQPAQGVPQARLYFSWWRRERGRGWNRLPAGLGQVPDVRDAARVSPAVVLFIAVWVSSLLAWIRKELDAFLIPVNLPAGRAPRLIAHDQARAWSLGRDEQDGCPVFAGQPCGCPQAPDPVLGRADLPRRLVQADAQCIEPSFAVLLLFALTFDSHCHWLPSGRLAGSAAWRGSRPIVEDSQRSRLLATV
jgi:hypothetical protein